MFHLANKKNQTLNLKSLVGKIKAALQNQLLDNEYKIAWRSQVGLEIEEKTHERLKVIEEKIDQILPKKKISQSCTGLIPCI